ncbi:MAG: protein TolR [Pseudomonadota bacterium]
MRRQRRMMSDINVVPYIDVMLVLLIIFMITAPLITQGVKVELPQANSKVIDAKEEEPVIVTVDAQGQTYVDIGETPEEAITDQTLVNRLAAVHKYRPQVEVLVKGDSGVGYGRIVEVMSAIQTAGIGSVGLISEPRSSR